MKKILLLAAIIGFSMTSCKKDYTCECTVTTSGTGMQTTTATGSTTMHEKKDDAKTECEKGSKTVENSGITSTTKCEIK